MSLPRWPYSHGPGGTDTIHGVVVRIEVQPFEKKVLEYREDITWKRGPIPKECRECHDTIGYHKPECSRPDTEYETYCKGVLPLVFGAVELTSDSGEFHPCHGLSFLEERVREKLREILLEYQEKILKMEAAHADSDA